MVVCFCGHADTPDNVLIRAWLDTTIRAQVERGADLFYSGGYGSFDRMAAKALWAIKQHSRIESVLVVPYIDRKMDASLYDETCYPPLESVPRRYAILRRNQWMVDHSDIVIACVNHDWGGAASMLSYAGRRKKEIINYFGQREGINNALSRDKQ